MKVSKPAVIFIIIISLIVLIGGGNLFYWKYRLHTEGVYILGRRTFLSTGGETGTAYNYRFMFHGNEYEVGSSGALHHTGQNDTLLYLHILPAYPDGYCDFLTDDYVPKCFKLSDVPYDGWKELPKDTCNYR